MSTDKSHTFDLKPSDIAAGIIRCDACPVLCRIKPAMTGACDRYANHDGKLVRLDPIVVTERALDAEKPVVSFAESSADWDGDILATGENFSLGLAPARLIPITNLRLLSSRSGTKTSIRSQLSPKVFLVSATYW